ncbi:MAG: hypothetical protein WC679_01265 [Bacteroidales bacterium]|jgi:hypothetical protein
MSYDITRWKQKSIDKLIINLDDLEYPPDMIKKGWFISIDYPNPIDSTLVHINIGSEGSKEIVGTLANGLIEVQSIDLEGEGSGSAFYYPLRKALLNSTGKYTAKLVWEGGDSISILTVIDGKITEDEDD